MTYFEIIDEMKANMLDEQNATKEAYLAVEADLAKTFGDYVMGAEMLCATYGPGKVTAVAGETLDNLILDIEFAEFTKRFSLLHIMTNSKFIQFADISEIGDAWDAAVEVHNNLTTAYNACKAALRQMQAEMAKKAEAEKKANEKYQRLKDKSIKDFEELQNRAKETITQADEFYYALGWLAKHVGTVSAALPDYLADSFAKYFGTETPCRVVDSKHRGPAGWQSQWSWSFKATLKNAKNIPAILSTYLNTSGKAIANTAFVWDLVDDYGFQFGKKQDIEKIKNTVPTQYLSMFEVGLSA